MIEVDMVLRRLKIAISKAGWSTPTQQLGDSKRREFEMTEKFCRKLLFTQ
jgi:hypothetical protein